MSEQKELITYEQIADSNGISGRAKERFVMYMNLRWGNPEDERIKCLCGYADEWAIRFKTGQEYNASDMVGHAVLKKIDGGMING